MRTPEWDLLLHIVKKGCTTLPELKRRYPRKGTTLERQLVQLVSSASIWMDGDKVCSLLIEPAGLPALKADLEDHTDAKRRLAVYIADPSNKLIQYDDSVFLDSGSTMVQLALHLAFEERLAYDIDILTNNPALLAILRGRVRKFLLVGGHVRNEGRIIPSAAMLTAAFESVNLSKSFISLFGLSPTKGLTCEDDIANLKLAAMRLTEREVVIPLEGSKLEEDPPGQPFMSLEDLRNLGARVTILVTKPSTEQTDWPESVERIRGQLGRAGTIKVIQ